MPRNILRKPVTAKRVGWSEPHLMRVATSPEYRHLNFPRPVRTGPNSIGFIEDEIDAWIEERIDERDRHGFVPKADDMAKARAGKTRRRR